MNGWTDGWRVDGWMDGEMDGGWMDGWMGGWMDGGWVDGWMDRWIDEWMGRWMVGGWMNGWTDGWWVDGWMDGWWVGRWMDGQINGWMDRCMVGGWMDGRVDGQMDGWVEGLGLHRGRSSASGGCLQEHGASGALLEEQGGQQEAATVLGDLANASDRCTKTSCSVLRGINLGRASLPRKRPTSSSSPDHSVCFWKAQNCFTCSRNTAGWQPWCFVTVHFSLPCGCSSDLGTVDLLPFCLYYFL